MHAFYYLRAQSRESANDPSAFLEHPRALKTFPYSESRYVLCGGKKRLSIRTVFPRQVHRLSLLFRVDYGCVCLRATVGRTETDGD